MAIDYVAAARAIVKRRKRALQLHNKGKNFTEIGEALGVTRQRAEQIVKAARRDQEATG